MENFEQIRAKNALVASGNNGFKGANDGEVVKKLPMMIIDSGFLGALAFACEGKEKKDGVFKLAKRGYSEVFIAFLKHLAVLSQKGFPVSTVNVESVSSKSDDKSIRDILTNFATGIKSADDLRTISNEALAYLSYLKRFAFKSGSEQTSNG